MKGRKAVVVAAAVALLLTGCGRSADNSQDNAKPVGDGKAKGDITVWAMGTEGEKLSTLADGLHEGQPGRQGQRDRGAVGRGAPEDRQRDRRQADPGRVAWSAPPGWGSSPRPARSTRPRDLIDKVDFFPGAWDTTVVDGTSYGVPWYVETRCLYYRKDLAAQGRHHQPPKTWDDLKAMAKALQDQGRREVGPLPAARPDRQLADLHAVRLVRTAPRSPRTASSPSTRPETAEALELLPVVLQRELSPTDLPAGRARAGLRQGQHRRVHLRPVAHRDPERPGRRRVREQVRGGQMPTKKSATSFVGGSDLAVFKDAKNRDGAWKFVSWLSKPRRPGQVVRPVNDLPAVQKCWDDPTLTGDPLLADVRRAAQGRQGPAGVSRPGSRSPRRSTTEVEKVCKCERPTGRRAQGHRRARPTPSAPEPDHGRRTTVAAAHHRRPAAPRRPAPARGYAGR